MAIYRYPQEVHDFVKKLAPKLRDDDLAEACNKELGTHFTASSMKAFRGNHGYRNGKKQWTREEYWKYQKHYPKGVYEFIRDNSWGVSSKDMAEKVNAKFGSKFTQNSMKQFRAKQGIRSGETGWFRKGHPPGNKGMRQKDYMSPEMIEKTKSTRFKKGDRPKNELPVGSIARNGGKVFIKISDAGSQWERWMELSRYVWEQNFGRIPDGMMVSFRDSDPLNCKPENLMLISKSENAVMNKFGLRYSDPEATESGVLVARIKMAAAKQRRRKKS